MRPHDRRATVLALVAFAALSSPLDAHNLLRSQGQAVIESDRVVVTFDVSPEDFNHLYGLIPATDGAVTTQALLAAAEDHADDLTTGLEIWDETGDRLGGGAFRLDPQQPMPPSLPWAQLRAMRLRFTASYILPTQRRFLTFRMNPNEQSAALARQWVVELRAGDDAAPQVIQLTSRGNAETVEIQWVDHRPRLRAHSLVPTEADGCASFENRGTARFHEIFVHLEPTTEALWVRTSVPLPLLESWIPLRRETEGRIGPDERAAILMAARELIGDALAVECDGEPLAADTLELRLLAANEASSANADATPALGYFSARLESLQRFSNPTSVEHLAFDWRLFNSAVLSARVGIRADGRCTSREFTSYSRTLEWRRDDSAAAGPR